MNLEFTVTIGLDFDSIETITATERLEMETIARTMPHEEQVAQLRAEFEQEFDARSGFTVKDVELTLNI